jgi:non-ribosomal peptide synthetase-like protein
MNVLRGELRPDLLRNEVLADIFNAAVAQNPDKTAFIFHDLWMSYAQVAQKSDALARGLIAQGIKPGDVVGIWLPRSVDVLIAQIGVTKAGAAWLPFDADAPIDRIALCLQDCEARLLLSGSACAKGGVVPCSVLSLAEVAIESEEPLLEPSALGLTPDHPAYMIYTSGSTGIPKGIVISHRNICHFLRSANEIYGIHADDVMFQGASVAFDLSMEEIWVPYLVGATLIIASPDQLGDIDQLPARLTRAGVTVLDTVPTLLGMLNEDIPSLRLILMGGEALPPSLIMRWAAPGRRMFNTYGPTEATVVATVAEVEPGKPVTIGKPIPNYSCHVVDDQLRPVGLGIQGELLIGGPGVAQGYLKRPELTAEKFIANPFEVDDLSPILYRSGDAVSLTEEGELLFHGRIDDQVKIRGFRVELGEIETHIAHQAGIAQAAVVIRQNNDIDQLAAFLVLKPSVALDVAALRSSLKELMPAYMVPARFEVISQLPILPSGKVDRKALKNLQLLPQAHDEQEEPRCATEAALLAAAKKTFGPAALSFEADFFNDLGGHSLLAARFVSTVRETPALAGITLNDIYALRTLRAIASHLIDTTGGMEGETVLRDLSFTPPPFMRRFLCGLAQAIAMPFILGLVTIQWLGLFLATVFLLNQEVSIWQEMAVLFTVYVTLNLGSKLAIIALKWLIIGRTKAGVYPLWGIYYFRVWLVQRLVQVTTHKFLQNSPLMRFYLRALGAKVGRDAMISDFEAGAVDLLSIGEGASLGPKTRFANVEVIGNEMIIGPITIGDYAGTGASCALAYDTVIGEGAEIGDLTAIAPGIRVQPYEKWDGSPGRKIGDVDRASLHKPAEASRARRLTQGVVYGLSYIVMLMLGLLPIFPAFYVLYTIDGYMDGTTDYVVPWNVLPLYAWPTAMVLILVAIAVIVVLRWVLMPTRISSGTHSIHSWFYIRKWVLGLATEVTLETLSSLYATIFMRTWYRMLGARIGKGSEISTNLSGRYDLVNIGADNFVGDETVLGDEEIHRGWMTLNEVKTGDRVFMGNDSVIGSGAVIEDGALIGVKSKLPPHLHVKENEIYFGSPSMKLPTRQRVSVEGQWTYAPSRWRLTLRGLFETLHTSLPTALFITCGYMTADLIELPLVEGRWTDAFGIFLSAGVVIALALAAIACIAKWLFIGVYKPVMKPMWSFWAMRTEAVAVLYGGLAGKASIEFFRGTPFLPMILRCFGAKIGKGVWMDLTDITEFDCIKIGDYCTLNMSACLQTHLYEDRVMKVGRIELGKGVHVGWNTTVLYDTHIGDYARLRPLTVVMKGENIPAHSEWEGAPSVSVRAPDPAIAQLAKAA